MTKVRLNLGCGAVRPAGWINADSSLNANLQRVPVIGRLLAGRFSSVVYDNNSSLMYMNLNKRWKRFTDSSVDIVYASHLFEHLLPRAANLFLTESMRCLRPQGVIRVVVPDLYKICKRYIEQYENENEGDPTDFIMWAINMHREGQYGERLSVMRKIFCEWQGYPHQHKYMYDERSLTLRLERVGFTNCRAHSYGQSSLIEEIRDVEGTKESYLSAYVEAIKP